MSAGHFPSVPTQGATLAHFVQEFSERAPEQAAPEHHRTLRISIDATSGQSQDKHNDARVATLRDSRGRRRRADHASSAAFTSSMSQTEPRRASDSDSDVPCEVEARVSDADLEKMAKFTEMMRDALGESGNSQELSPEQAAERGCLSTLRSLHRRGYFNTSFCEDVCVAAAKGGQLDTMRWLLESGARFMTPGRAMRRRAKGASAR